MVCLLHIKSPTDSELREKLQSSCKPWHGVMTCYLLEEAPNNSQVTARTKDLTDVQLEKLFCYKNLVVCKVAQGCTALKSHSLRNNFL